MPAPPAIACSLLLTWFAIAGPLGAQSFRDEGTEAFQRGDYAAAATLLEKSVASALKAMKEEDIEVVERRAELGEAYRAAGRLDDAIRQLDYVWKRARYDAENKKRWGHQEGTLALAAAEKLGRTYLAAGRYQDALLVFSTGLYDSRRTQHDEDALQFSALLAETQFVAKDDVEAAQLVAHAVALAEKLTANPVLQARALSQLGALCLRHNQLGLARPMAQRALEIARKLAPAGGVLVADSQAGLAAVLLQTGLLDEAEHLLREARETILAKETPQSLRLVEVLIGSAELSLRKSQPGAALEDAANARDICRRKPFEADPQTGRAIEKLADCRLALQEPQLAKALYEEALAIFEKTLGPDDPSTVRARGQIEKIAREPLSPAASSAPTAPDK